MDILYFLFLGLVVGFWGGGDCARRRIRRHIEDARASAASDSEASASPTAASDSEASASPSASVSEARLFPSFASAAKQG